MLLRVDLFPLLLHIWGCAFVLAVCICVKYYLRDISSVTLNASPITEFFFYTCGYLLVQLLAASGIMVILVAFTFLLLRMLHVYIKHSTNLGSEDFYYV